jgi:hypothetical protein
MKYEVWQDAQLIAIFRYRDDAVDFIAYCLGGRGTLNIREVKHAAAH